MVAKHFFQKSNPEMFHVTFPYIRRNQKTSSVVSMPKRDCEEKSEALRGTQRTSSRYTPFNLLVFDVSPDMATSGQSNGKGWKVMRSASASASVEERHGSLY